MDPETETFTPAVKRAADEVYDRRFDREAEDVAYNALAAALDGPQMAAAIVDHLLTDTLSDDSETLVCACGHVLVTGDPDDDRDPQAEHATHHAALIRAALIGEDS